MNFMTSFSQVSTLILLILVGYGISKMNLVSSSFSKDLNHILIYITLPALIIKSMQYEFSKDMVSKSITIIIISICVYAITIAISYLTTKLIKIKGKERDILQFLLIFPNVGFMGYPIISSIYGDIGVFYTALFNMPFEFIVWTLGVFIMTRNTENKEGMSLKHIFKTPGLIAIFIGYTFFLLSIKLPEPIYNTLNLLGSATVPIAMLVVGNILSQSSISEPFKNKNLIFLCFVRLLLIPIFIFIILRYCTDFESLLLGIPFIVSAMPSAAYAVIFATKFDNDYVMASQGVFLSTLVSCITIPILIFMLQI